MSESSPLRLVYLVNARMPTEKAHGYQVAKMCQAFAAAGCDVELWHPRRHQGAGVPAGASVFDYYGIPESFAVRAVANWDLIRLVDALPGRLGDGVFSLHACAWSLFAAAAAARRRADLYYTRDAFVALWLVVFGCPTVCELHRGATGPVGWVLRRIGRRPHLRGVVAITEAGRQEVLGCGVPAHRVAVCPDGVDPANFEDLPPREECRRRLGLPLEARIVGYVGRFQTMAMSKGLEGLVQAVALLQDCVEPPILLCVGGPMDVVPGYRREARRHGLPEAAVHFVDRVANREVPAWIRACDVVTLPFPPTNYYRRFPSPLKLFEYLAAGAAIVASDLPALREVLVHGENAWLVEPGRPEALAAGLGRVLAEDGLRERLAAGAAQSARSYTWGARAAGILASCDRPEPRLAVGAAR